MVAARTRRRRLTAASLTGAVTALLLAAPASAAAGSEDADAYVRAHDHPMGSQIARVEGDRSTVWTKKMALEPQGRAPDGGEATATVAGIDVSGWQKNVDWKHWRGEGKRFAYVKATEGTGYTSPYFAQQYNGSYDVGMTRGAYHFALPDRSSGAVQANYFVDHGGGWSADGKTLPGALDMEYNPYGDTCYGKSKSQMASWIRDFHDTYHSRTGRYPVIYTSAGWWKRCVGSAQSFGDTVPLWVARYSSSIGELPHGWNFHTFWQYTSDPIDQNSFNGTSERLKALAKG